jgi:ectoine hydroxylase-related dioxygenase (phytanoyl-CoA dioxygenase family)
MSFQINNIPSAEVLASDSSGQNIIESYKKIGAIVITGALTADQISDLQDSSEHFAINREDGEPKYSPYLHMQLVEQKFAELVCLKSIVTPAEIILGGKVELLQSMLYYKPPGFLGFNNHQDNLYLRVAPEDALISAWIALDDADEENGCLNIYPGSHNEPVLETRDTPPKQLASGQTDTLPERKFETILPPNTESVPVNIRAGSVIYFHGNLIHGSGPNISQNRFRRALVIPYIVKGATFREGETSNRFRQDAYTVPEHLFALDTEKVS